MAINPRPPVPGPIQYDYRHGDDFLAPAHMIKQELPTAIRNPDPEKGIPNMLPGDPIETAYDPAEILAQQPPSEVRPIFLGLRKALAERRIQRANAQLEELAQRQLVVRHIGKSLLTNNTYTDEEIGDQPNIYRPSSSAELRAAKRLDKITTKRRRAGGLEHGLSQNTSVPVRATWTEGRQAKKSSKRYDQTVDKMGKLDREFGAVIAEPSKKAARVVAHRNRLVAKQEGIERAIERRDIRRDKRAEKIRQISDDIQGSARALGEEIIEQHYESWDMTREQAERLAKASARAGRLVLNETVDTAKFAAKGSRYTADFSAEVARGAADIYWQAAKYTARQGAKGAKGAVTKTKSKFKRNNSR